MKNRMCAQFVILFLLLQTISALAAPTDFCAAYLMAQPTTGFTAWWRRTTGDARNQVVSYIEAARGEGRHAAALDAIDAAMNVGAAERRAALLAALQTWVSLDVIDAQTQTKHYSNFQKYLTNLARNNPALATELGAAIEDLLIDLTSHSDSNAQAEKQTALLLNSHWNTTGVERDREALLQKSTALTLKYKLATALIIAQYELSPRLSATAWSSFAQFIFKLSPSIEGSNIGFGAKILFASLEELVGLFSSSNESLNDTQTNVQNTLNTFATDDSVHLYALYDDLVIAVRDAIHTRLLSNQGSMNSEFALAYAVAKGKLEILIAPRGSMLFFQIKREPNTIYSFDAFVAQITEKVSGGRRRLRTVFYPQTGFGAVISDSGMGHDDLAYAVTGVKLDGARVDVTGGMRYEFGSGEAIDSLWCESQGLAGGVQILNRYFTVRFKAEE